MSAVCGSGNGCDMHVSMGLIRAAMRVRGLGHFHRQDIQMPVSHPWLGYGGIGKSLHPVVRAPQNHSFHAVVMIQMDMQGGNDRSWCSCWACVMRLANSRS